ncbi:hypothetical protein [Halobacterium yunchengense]|uniref:hypothetical protein n=1 Tax=Halobacterium yunchengense TaxID=3108497 RepID=UPI00300ABF2D
MELTRDVVETRAAEYADEEPLYAVEREQVETFPDAVRDGEYGWRDAEWVLQWYFRRFLGAYPDAERRAVEAAFGENDYEALRDALDAAVSAEAVAARVDALTGLAGVDVRVASAFLQFLFPERHVVVGDREWGVLVAADELADPYPDALDAADYETFDDACLALQQRLGVDAWALYRALWRLGAE